MKVIDSQMINNLKWLIRRVFDNFHRPRCFWYYLIDKQFRMDLKNLSNLLAGKTWKVRLIKLHIEKLRFSHRITYPENIDGIVRQYKKSKIFKPIKVIYLGKSKY
jgi:hypothetical protein